MFRTAKMVVHPEWQALLQAHGLDTLRGVYENSAMHRIQTVGLEQRLPFGMNDHLIRAEHRRAR